MPERIHRHVHLGAAAADMKLISRNVMEAFDRQLGDRPDAGGGVDQDGEDRAVAQAEPAL